MVPYKSADVNHHVPALCSIGYTHKATKGLSIKTWMWYTRAHSLSLDTFNLAIFSLHVFSIPFSLVLFCFAISTESEISNNIFIKKNYTLLKHSNIHCTKGQGHKYSHKNPHISDYDLCWSRSIAVVIDNQDGAVSVWRIWMNEIHLLSSLKCLCVCDPLLISSHRTSQ